MTYELELDLKRQRVGKHGFKSHNHGHNHVHNHGYDHRAEKLERIQGVRKHDRLHKNGDIGDIVEYDIEDEEHPINLICLLCKDFYYNNWVTGTGGGLSIRDGKKKLIYLAPSGVQKEKIEPNEIFILRDYQNGEEKENEIKRGYGYDGLIDNYKDSGKYLYTPNEIEGVRELKNTYKPSQCTPLFLSTFKLRNSGACIHTHSQNAVLISLLIKKQNYFRISHIEQIKAIPFLKEKRNLRFDENLVIPIIDNKNFEEDLTDSLQEAIERFPNTTAVLVKRHGIYVWGEDIWKAKIYNEAIDYLLEIGIKMIQNRIPLSSEDGEDVYDKGGY
ncbi:methylthioribulose 1-phosphate dehydratase MDE1 [Ascoidea rubescens DSM 1968]|uniref:Methylthioribulose-1-phosphate dehydratase n=1 Tax=Ascoidea rubescens DSM 1968 TaxID=1344418 RepID=A0A1D2VP19_9ASCO|nr:arad-like aldolase/epimerase [Ascoidea rubescens DSM 1968]ODV63353.1 arad-like aldolase/epimerase [Ascoidea rubescens DSM 1968]